MGRQSHQHSNIEVKKNLTQATPPWTPPKRPGPSSTGICTGSEAVPAKNTTRQKSDRYGERRLSPSPDSHSSLGAGPTAIKIVRKAPRSALILRWLGRSAEMLCVFYYMKRIYFQWEHSSRRSWSTRTRAIPRLQELKPNLDTGHRSPLTPRKSPPRPTAGSPPTTGDLTKGCAAVCEEQLFKVNGSRTPRLELRLSEPIPKAACPVCQAPLYYPIPPVSSDIAMMAACQHRGAPLFDVPPPALRECAVSALVTQAPRKPDSGEGNSGPELSVDRILSRAPTAPG
ncbi:hypothetical protein SKAU_G00058090 [Synaphobranchus kaupii]|uniref:Uncharacterized protein n=1 Tax=Synaphobranchus kaupii TaxID=118154 RepID=A0A9Q1G4B1_SYNKA|nr:hypothetical protein SKAU_G00058090 [Synaphobranchus kaupii]